MPEATIHRIDESDDPARTPTPCSPSCGPTTSPAATPALRDRLILHYAPLVKYVAGRVGSGLPAHVEQADLVSYGTFGLIDAITRYEPTREVKFESYAMARIRGAIIDELRNTDWIPRSVRMKARPFERAVAELEAKLQRTPTDEEVADVDGHGRRGDAQVPRPAVPGQRRRPRRAAHRRRRRRLAPAR